jgi:hypothetical protein
LEMLGLLVSGAPQALEPHTSDEFDHTELDAPTGLFIEVAAGVGDMDWTVEDRLNTELEAGGGAGLLGGGGGGDMVVVDVGVGCDGGDERPNRSPNADELDCVGLWVDVEGDEKLPKSPNPLLVEAWR